MYPIDERDVVVELNDVPKPRGGAPMPLVLADDDVILVLSYFLQEAAVGEDRNAGVAILEFHAPLMHLLGPPNDEAMKGHPLWRRGLDSYLSGRPVVIVAPDNCDELRTPTKRSGCLRRVPSLHPHV